MNTKFFYKPFEPGRYWSNRKNDYFYSDSIENQVLIGPDTPVPGKCISLSEAMMLAQKHNDGIKEHRGFIQLFNTDHFVYRDKADFSNWNGIVFVDLDLNKSERFIKFADTFGAGDRKAGMKIFYNGYFKPAMKELFPNNFYAFETSSSGIGIHIFLYFDVEHTIENHKRCAIYVKERIMNHIGKLINKFDEILSEDGIFDPVYNRPFQKCYITGNDAEVFDDITGEVNLDGISLPVYEPMSTSDIYCVEHIDFESVPADVWKDKKNGNDLRFHFATAIKAVTDTKDEWMSLWVAFNKRLEGRKHSAEERIRRVNYNCLKPEALPKSRIFYLLNRFGIVVDRRKKKMILKPDQFLSDIYDQIMTETTTGCNILQVGTGVGKTTIWKKVHEGIWGNADSRKSEKPILIIEPLNSIITSKYLDDNTKKVMPGVHLICGETPLPKKISEYGLYVTSYNKLLRRREEGGFDLMEDVEGFFDQFQYVVVDESHILSKDDFRADVIIPLIDTINIASKKTKVLLQTATPMDEEYFFDVKNFIKVSKPSNRHIDFIFRNADEDKPFELSEMICLVNHYIRKGRKVYIYAKSYPLEKMEKFRNDWFDPARVAIVHKRNDGEDSQNDILINNQMLGDKYDILISSVYFGVGCDLNDEGKAAVIIVGNNAWQEDVQVVGRWRNATDIKVCQVNLPADVRKLSSEATLERGEMMMEQKIKYQGIWNDRTQRINSDIIRKMGWMLQKSSDIQNTAYILSAVDYYNQYKVKMNALMDLYYGWEFEEKGRLDKPLTSTAEYVEWKEWKAKVVDIVNDKRVQKIMLGEYRGLTDDEVKAFWSDIHRSSKVDKWSKVWLKLSKWNISLDVDTQWVGNLSNYSALKEWSDMYESLRNGDADISEITSMLSYRYMMENGDPDEDRMLRGRIMPAKKYWLVMTYLRWLTFKDTGTVDFRLAHNYMKSYKAKVEALMKVPASMMDLLYRFDQVKREHDAGLDWFIDPVMGIDNPTSDHSLEELMSKTEAMNLTIDDRTRMIDRALAALDGDRVTVVKMSRAKEIVITDKAPEKWLMRYGLKPGDRFESIALLIEKKKMSKQSISRWKSNGWIA